MNRSKWHVSRPHVSFPKVHMAVGWELYTKYSRMFCIHSFLAVSVHLVGVCRKINPGKITRRVTVKMGKSKRCKETKMGCLISRTKTDICTILPGSFGNTLAFNSSYIHYSIVRCRYIDIQYLYLHQCNFGTHRTSIYKWLNWNIEVLQTLSWGVA